jgi:site-specific DNA recombinase
MELTAAFYGRQSTDKSDTSRDTQLEHCREYVPEAETYLAEAYRQPVHVTLPDRFLYFDRDESGTVYERTDYDRCKRAAGAGEFDLLLVYAMDRLGRGHPYDTMAEVNYFRHLGMPVFCWRERFEATGADDIVVLRVALASIEAHSELAKIKDRLKGGRVTANRLDPEHWFSGTVPYGFRLDGDKHLVVDEREARVVRRMFRWVMEENLSYNEIAHRLNREGYPAPSAGRKYKVQGRWGASSVKNILSNNRSVAGGGVDFQVTDERAGKTFTITVPGPAIVEPVEWNKAQNILSRRSQIKRRTNFYLLKQILTCRECGEKLVGTAAGRGTFYVCRRRQYARLWGVERCDLPRVPVEVTDPVVWRRVVEYIDRPGLVELALGADEADRLREIKTELVRVEAQVESKQRALKRLALDWVHDVLGEDALQDSASRIRADLEELDRRRIELELSRSVWKRRRVHVQQLCAMQSLDLDRMSPEGKQALVQELVYSIGVEHVSDTGVRLHPEFYLLSDELMGSSDKFSNNFATFTVGDPLEVAW